MISDATLLILGGSLLGMIQLIAGIAIGMWLRRAENDEAHRGRQAMIRASEVAQRLQALADEMSMSVGEHRTRLDRASQLLTSEEARADESLAELVVDVIGDIVRANQNLQSKLETAESRLEEQAAEIQAHISRSLTDPLTGLPNRREFDARLEERMDAWHRRRQPFSLLLIDVDYFKKLNDQHGHLAGDAVLVGVAETLRRSVRSDDLVARYGGEEFAVLLPSASLENASRVAEKIRAAVVVLKVNHHELQLQTTVSIGVATIKPREQAESLIGRADAALYMAKAAARNCAFAHDGSGCRPVSSTATKSAGLLSHDQSALDSSADERADDGYPPEPISAELAQTCDELRQFLQSRLAGQQGDKSEQAGHAAIGEVSGEAAARPNSPLP